ncbi:hypothetical protein NE237_016547 [Protea cynaroides]|uniref:Uncharacterized protein n=1 Tax=Protea cynaroides TaxID=273540 RepID=A0A9Q0K724_9MAGN|nr:hypothetical protein NE237_016547 [Protea cynaroides]
MPNPSSLRQRSTLRDAWRAVDVVSSQVMGLAPDQSVQGETRGSMLPLTAEGRHSSGLVPSPIVFLAGGSRAVRGMEQQRSVSRSGDRVADVSDGCRRFVPMAVVSGKWRSYGVLRSHLEILHDRNQGVLQSKNSGTAEASLSDNSGCAKKGGQSWAVNLRVLLQGLGYLSSKQSRSVNGAAGGSPWPTMDVRWALKKREDKV